MADDEQTPDPGPSRPGNTTPDPAAAAGTVGTPGTAGGAADEASPVTLPSAGTRSQFGLGEARPISVSHDSGRKKAAPLPDDPDYQGFYSGPPAAPLPDAPTG